MAAVISAQTLNSMQSINEMETAWNTHKIKTCSLNVVLHIKGKKNVSVFMIITGWIPLLVD